MREFILLARRAVTAPFPLNDLPGAGRMDVVCRCATQALFLSEAVRRDTVFTAVLNGPPDPPRSVAFHGSRVRRVSPDERNVASHLRIALEARAGPGEAVESEAGIVVSRKSFEQEVRERRERGVPLFLLDPAGEDLRTADLPPGACFVLGDARGLPEKTAGLLQRLGARRVSVGPREYLASQAIVLVHNELDRRGF